jgi:fructokinase
MTGGVEAGGTKFICGVGTGPDDLETLEFPTTDPEETIDRVLEFFEGRAVDRIGVGSFGPVDLKSGYITTTPKLAWRNIDLLGAIRRGTGVPVTLDTDVNAAALGEFCWGAAKDVNTFMYVTIGTGIGGGGMVSGRMMHGLQHPEMGHVRIPHDWQADPYPGLCPSHGDCLEGLASGPAIEARWGLRAFDLPPEHPAWDLEARYLAFGLVNWICTLSPQRVIVGGGVMRQAGLLPKIRANLEQLVNGYFPLPEIVLPGLGERAGILGALALASKCGSSRNST